MRCYTTSYIENNDVRQDKKNISKTLSKWPPENLWSYSSILLCDKNVFKKPSHSHTCTTQVNTTLNTRPSKSVGPFSLCPFYKPGSELTVNTNDCIKTIFTTQHVSPKVGIINHFEHSKGPH